jgi:tRNA threonylcarbamoyl adenosine modification protein YeaZ
MLFAIETATSACSIALFLGDRLIDERHEVVGRGHAEKLVPMIEAMLAGRRPSALLVDCGPGSFTGIRVGIAAAQGMAIGWNLPLHGYSSLALIAAAGDEPEVGVALEGGHGQLFVQSYKREPLAATDMLASLTPSAAASRITAPVVAGSGAEALIAARGYGMARPATLRASDVMRLPAELRSSPARPIYGRPPDAKPMA